MTLHLGDQALDFQIPGEPSTTNALGRPIAYAQAAENATCPICLESAADSREHAPPLSVGGQVMLKTCTPCNNRAEERMDSGLRRWRVTQIDLWLEASDVPGRRRLGPGWIRASDQETAIIPINGLPPAFRGALRSGSTGVVTSRVPNPVAVNAGVLKYALLGACLLLGQIPRTALAEQDRGEILAALRTPRDEPFPADPSVRSATPFRVTTTMVRGGSIGVWWPLEDELVQLVVSNQAQRDEAIKRARHSNA